MHLEKNLSPIQFERILDEDTVLVAEAYSRVVGYVQFGSATSSIKSAPHNDQEVRRLYVLSDFQNQGIGSTLVRRGLEISKDQGHRIVVVLGHPHYYSRFGFSSKMAVHLNSPFSGRESFMAVELVAGALHGVKGKVEYPPPFASF